MTDDPKNSSNPAERALIAADLRDRALFMLDAFNRDEPSESWRTMRELVEKAQKLGDLRVIYRDIRSILGAMRPSSREQLERQLLDRFGPDAERSRDDAIVAKVVRAGRIESEREYRAVSAYLDALSGDQRNESEAESLGALLDVFMAGPG